MIYFEKRIFLLIFFFLSSFRILVAFTPSSQIEGLEFLFNATNGTYWNWNNEDLDGPKWSFTSPPQSDPCYDENTGRTWQGITCSAPPNVCRIQKCDIIALNLRSYRLDGTLPAEFFKRITSMNFLRFSASRDLTGSIPSEIGLLTQLRYLGIFLNNIIGSIPSEIGLLTLLKDLYLDTNAITGVIPPELFALNQLSMLYLNNNHLTGSIPSQVGLLTQLSSLVLYSNQLTGPIPSQLSLLTNLHDFSLSDNQLTGNIPSELFLLTQLDSIILSYNQLTGTIPSPLNSLENLYYFNLVSNYISGTLPSMFSSFTGLKYFDVAFNQLTGTIPSEYNTFTLLDSISLYENQLTGSIPPSFFITSHNLQYFYLYSNQLSGNIPPEIGLLTNLKELYLYNNSLTGTIPTTINNLKNLTQLHLYENQLKGELNFQLDSFPSLEHLFLQQNHFHGHLNQLFSTSISFNSSNHSLINIDLSDNQFSGSIPSQLFLYPHLQSISLSLNCFEHELPSSMCEAVGVGVISMDGLGSSKHCPNVVKVPFTSVSLVQSIEGNIPDCVWLLSKLKILNLAGNALSGTIGKISSMSSLLSLTLSHNYLSGTIPLWIQKKNMSQLDLSHNKLMGRVDGFKQKNQEYYNEELINETIGSKYVGRSLKLSVNRLSGGLFHSFDKYSILDILAGNLFGCDYLPSNDEDSDSTICGSEEFDQSMIVMGGVCGLIMMLIIFYGLCLFVSLLLSSPADLPPHDLNSNVPRIESQNNEKNTNTLLLWIESRLTDFHLIIHYTKYYSVDDLLLRDSLTSIRLFGYFLSHLIKSLCFLTIVLLIFSLPIYVLKVLDMRSQDGEEDNGETSEYITHSEMYRWLWTMSFISGTIPSILLMIVMLISLMIFCLILNGLGVVTIKGRDTSKNDDHNNVGADERINSLSSQKNSLIIMNHLSVDKENDKRDELNNVNHFSYLVWIIFIGNIAIVGTVNALYLWSTFKDLSTDSRILIQFTFGLFTFAWHGIILRGGLPVQMKESRNGVWLFTCLNIVNTVVIPCVVTALSDPSCYQRLLIPPDVISSTYTYQACSVFLFSSDGSVSCLNYVIAVMNPLKFTPPFTYSYQCGSTLLVSYIPVYMYSLSFQLLLLLLKMGLSFSISSNVIQLWLMKFISPINFPLQVTNIINSSTNSTIQLIKPHEIISGVMNNLILLLSFGLCSPVLSCYITLNIFMTLWSCLLLIGRFVHFRLTSNSSPLPLDTTSQVEKNPILSDNENHFDIVNIIENDEGVQSESTQNNNPLQSIEINNANSRLRFEEEEGGGEGDDDLLNLLNRQLQNVNSSLVVCKWPILCTSCLFITLLCWDMVGDEMGWDGGFWVPCVGLAMLITIRIWDRFLIPHVLRLLDQHKYFFFSFSSCSPSHSLSRPPSQPLSLPISPSKRLSSISNRSHSSRQRSTPSFIEFTPSSLTFLDNHHKPSE